MRFSLVMFLAFGEFGFLRSWFLYRSFSKTGKALRLGDFVVRSWFLCSSFSGTEKTILPSDDIGFRKHTWKLTHSQVICCVPCVSGCINPVSSGKKNQKEDSAKQHHQKQKAEWEHKEGEKHTKLEKKA